MLPRRLPENPIRFIRDCIERGRVLWTYHVNMRLSGRFIPREAVLRAQDTYELVENYPDDKYLPSYLVLGRYGGEAFHVLFALDVAGGQCASSHGIPPEPDGMGVRSENEETKKVKCTICGAELRATRTSLPFKIQETSIVILKSLPILQCENCSEYLIDDAVLRRVDEILARVDRETELEIISYAA